ncbi:MAG TPA: TonB-dependent receptor [Ignavibacteria bacterium]|nr:TonB-dependent receptor [Ignavibacteria bacterium]HMQ98549.1 TonB-dependent receptor [Ignavibacteria bacterium]
MVKYLIILLIFIINIPAQEIISSGQDSVVTDEIVVESNRLKMKNSEAPNKIQVIDAELLKRINGSRLPDALSLSDAVFIKDYGFNSGTKTISLNATQSEHTLVLIDGIRLNSRQNAQYDLSLFDLEDIERIEISKGGSSALYGSDAIGGVINIITSRDPKKPFSFNIKGETGSYGYRKFYGKLSQYFKLGFAQKLSFNILASDERAENEFDFNFKNGPVITEYKRMNSDFNTQGVNFDIKYLQSDEMSLKYFARYSSFTRGVPGIFLGYSTGSARQEDKIAMTGFSFDKKISGKVFSKCDLTYQYQLQKYYDPATFNLTTVINSFYKLRRVSASSVYSILISDKFNLESGAELNLDDISSNETEEGKATQAAVFAVSKYIFNISTGSVLTFYPSARYDYYSNISEHNVLTGKFGINFKPFGRTDFHIKSSFGNNFSAPTFNELYWKDIGNKDLRPEKSLSFDAGLYYKFDFASVNELEVSYYNIYTKDRIVWTPVSGSIWRPLNIQKVSSEGIDASLKSELSLSKFLFANVGINYSFGSAIKKSEDFSGDPSFGKQLIYLPKEMVKGSIMMNYLTTSKLLKYVSFSLFYNFSTRRYTNFENTQFIPRYDVVDGNIAAGFKFSGFETDLRFIVNNILNEDYTVLPGYPMPLRNYKIEINLKYQ